MNAALNILKMLAQLVGSVLLVCVLLFLAVGAAWT